MAPEYYIFTGRERVPRHVTHVLMDEALKFVPARAFRLHPNIEEVICHDGVEKIEQGAFYECPRLRRVIMPGVKEVKQRAFQLCCALTSIECGKLERIGECAFGMCESLSSIDLPSIKRVEDAAIYSCTKLINAKFGKDLESIRGGAFKYCTSLERIALPLKNYTINAYDVFQGCKKLNHIDLVEGAILDETIAALHMEEWQDGMSEEIDAINRILSNAPSGNWNDPGEKAQAIQAWIRSVLRKIIHYKAQHCRYVNEAASTLQPALPNDILFKNVLPFLELPSHRFEGEN